MMINEEKGQSLVEMALILPLLLLLLVGIVDIGRMLYTSMHLHLATQETVRLGGLGASDAEMTSFAKDYVNIGDVSLLEVDIYPQDEHRNPGQYVTVTLEYPMNFLTPFISKVLSSPFNLNANSTIRIE